ncbi:hypothetical protein SDC9_201051 [bioreactor metagenome]|uniref:Uncharacterized protein n=1 Tax=bioreactor metagenome TaxID=1076179 RepID=A0A645IQ80_9ZZZZ
MDLAQAAYPPVVYQQLRRSSRMHAVVIGRQYPVSAYMQFIHQIFHYALEVEEIHISIHPYGKSFSFLGKLFQSQLISQIYPGKLKELPLGYFLIIVS